MKDLFVFFVAVLLSIPAIAQPPATIAGPTGVCVGAAILLTDASPGGTWSSSDAAIASAGITSGIVTGGSASGICTITYTTGGGSVTTDITVNALPAPFYVNGGGTYCPGGTGLSIGLSGSATVCSYQLYAGGSPVDAPVPGTGGPLYFGDHTAGVYQVTGRDVITGCAINMTGSAVVTMAPDPLPLTGPATICAGGTGAYTAGTPYGTWSSSNAAVMTMTGGAGTATGVSPGTATITYVTPAGCFATKSVTITPGGLPITGASAVCAGGHIYLSDITIGGTWTSGSPWIATIGSSTGVVSGISAGSALMYYTSPGTGCSVHFTVNVAASPPPIAGPSVVCVGTSINFSDLLTAGVWGVSNTSVATVNPSGTVTGISPGIMTITYAIYSGCSTAKTITVNTASAPITGSANVCAGTTSVLSCLTPGGIWSSGSLSIATIGSLSGVVSGVHGGAAAVSYTTPAGCIQTITMTVDTGGMTGPGSICAGNTYLSPWGPGTWTSSNPSVAGVGSSSGLITGISAGVANISYTSNSGCHSTFPIHVSAYCSGTPGAGYAHADIAMGCIGQTILLYLGGISTPCGMAHQWQSSPDSVSWTDLAGLAADSVHYTPPGYLYYRCRVTCLSSGLSAWSGAVRVLIHSTITAHTVTNPTDTTCTGTRFFVSACGVSPALTVATSYGDGQSDLLPLTSSGVCNANFFHSYAVAGTYTVKQVLYLAGVPQDSIQFSYEHVQCRYLAVKLFEDGNSNCLFDPTDFAFSLPATVEVDSNGTAVDTISVTSGFYYKAMGPAGTVYRFKVIATVAGQYVSCPASGAIYDTLTALTNGYPVKYFGMSCTSGAAFDLATHTSVFTGRHKQDGIVVVDNTYCSYEASSLTVHFSPNYDFVYAEPMPAAVSGHSATWNVPPISAATAGFPVITYHLKVPGMWLTAGDTVQTNGLLTPSATGDIDTNNNIVVRTDTVKASYDPNEISVLPAGRVPSCTRLQYTIRFENTGNDTARNIYVMDTLSDGLDPGSLRIEIASAVMNVVYLNDGMHHIIKFDFPKINLADTSHHKGCDGIVIFNIRTRPGLAQGTAIPNYAGIFFDDNPAVMTDTVTSVIGLNPISGTTSACMGQSTVLGAPEGFAGGTWSGSAGVSVGSSSGIVTGITSGPATVTYTYTNVCGPTSQVIPYTVKPSPAAYPMSGGGRYCTGDTGVHIYIDGSEAGTNYFLYHGITATGSFAGTGSILDMGLQTIPGTYTVHATNTATTCSRVFADSERITVLPIVTPSVSIISMPGATVCAGGPATFTSVGVNAGSSPGYLWNVNGTNVSTAGTYTFGPANGDVVTLTLTSDTPCASPAMVTDAVTLTVDNVLAPWVNISADPGYSIAPGQIITLTATVSGGGMTVSYQWYLDGAPVTGATDAGYSGAFADHDSVTCVVTTGNICGEATARRSEIIYVNTTGTRPIRSAGGMDIYPNPNKGEFTVAGDIGGAGEDEVSAVVSNVVGRVIYTTAIPCHNGNIHAKIALDKPAQGMYLLSLRRGGEQRVYHFVVE